MTVTAAQGATSADKTITVQVSGDTAVEPDNGFTVTLSGASGAGLGTDTAAGNILNDDDELSIAVDDATRQRVWPAKHCLGRLNIANMYKLMPNP